jgi:nucleosome binding factor SPN SPT16 subunit
MNLKDQILAELEAKLENIGEAFGEYMTKLVEGKDISLSSDDDSEEDDEEDDDSEDDCDCDCEDDCDCECNDDDEELDEKKAKSDAPAKKSK